MKQQSTELEQRENSATWVGEGLLKENQGKLPKEEEGMLASPKTQRFLWVWNGRSGKHQLTGFFSQQPYEVDTGRMSILKIGK